MKHGGKRERAGRKKGSKNLPAFALDCETVEGARKGPTPAERQRALKRAVALAVHDGMAPEKISILLGIPLDRLRALFGHELSHGREIIRLAELQRLDRASDAGSVAASKAVLSAPGATSGPTDTASGKSADKTRTAALFLLNGGKR